MSNKRNPYLNLTEKRQSKRLVLNNTRQYRDPNFRQNLVGNKRQFNDEQYSPKLKPSKIQRTSYFKQEIQGGYLSSKADKNVYFSNNHSRQKIKSHYSQMPYKNMKLYDQDMISEQKKAINSLYSSHETKTKQVQIRDLQKKKSQKSMESSKGQQFIGILDNYISELTFQKQKSTSKYSPNTFDPKQHLYAFQKKNKNLNDYGASNQYVRNLREIDIKMHEKYLTEEFIKQKVNNVLLLKQLQQYRRKQSQNQNRIDNLENNIQKMMHQIIHLNAVLDEQTSKKSYGSNNLQSNFSYQQFDNKNNFSYNKKSNYMRDFPILQKDITIGTFGPRNQIIDPFQQQYCLHIQQKFGENSGKFNLNSLRSMRR